MGPWVGGLSEELAMWQTTLIPRPFVDNINNHNIIISLGLMSK